MSGKLGASGAGILSALLLLLIFSVVALLAINGFASSRASQARQGWDATLGSFEDIMQRYPATPANASALELERLAAAVGLDIVPRSVQRKFRDLDTVDRRSAFVALKKDVFSGGYARQQMERVGRGEIDAPPADLVAFIDEHEDALQALRDHLLTQAFPVWESDLSRVPAAPLPNLLGQIDLYKLFTNLAFVRLHAGDRDGALQYVEASRQLGRSLRDSPSLISQLILMAGARLQLGVLRHVPDLSSTWIERMGEHDFRRTFLAAMKIEGWAWLHAEGAFRTTQNTDWWEEITAPVMQPYTKLCLADASAEWRKRLAALEALDTLCDRDLDGTPADLALPLPSWNKVGEMIVPNLANAVQRLARLELDLEMTRVLFEADAARRANGGRWPRVLPSRQSETCPEDRWTHTLSDAGLSVAFSREISWPGQKGPILPTQALIR